MLLTYDCKFCYSDISLLFFELTPSCHSRGYRLTATSFSGTSRDLELSWDVLFNMVPIINARTIRGYSRSGFHGQGYFSAREKAKNFYGWEKVKGKGFLGPRIVPGILEYKFSGIHGLYSLVNRRESWDNPKNILG